MNASRLALLLACSLLAAAQAAAGLNATSAGGGRRALLAYKPNFKVQGRGTELSSSIVFVSVYELETECNGEQRGRAAG